MNMSNGNGMRASRVIVEGNTCGSWMQRRKMRKSEGRTYRLLAIIGLARWPLDSRN